MLVVEDDPAIAHLLKEYLSREEFEVDVAADGELGVELARGTRPDVIIVISSSPASTGLEACGRLRAFSDACVLMLMARGEEVDRVVGLSVGAGRPADGRHRADHGSSFEHSIGDTGLTIECE